MDIIALFAFYIAVYLILFITVFSLVKLFGLAYKRKEIVFRKYRAFVINSVVGGFLLAMIIPLILLLVLENI